MTNNALIEKSPAEPEPKSDRSNRLRSFNRDSGRDLGPLGVPVAVAVAVSGAGGARRSFTSLWPFFHVHTRSLVDERAHPGAERLAHERRCLGLGQEVAGIDGSRRRRRTAEAESLDVGLGLGSAARARLGDVRRGQRWDGDRRGEGDAAVVVDGGAVVVSAAGVWHAPTASATMARATAAAAGFDRPVRFGCMALPS